MFDLEIIGCGKMGRAILEGVVRSGTVSEADIAVIDLNPTVQDSLRGDRPAVALLDLPVPAKLILIATKPNMVEEVCSLVDTTGHPILISIAAGISIATIERSLGSSKVKVVRAMPNMPGQIGLGITAISPGTATSTDDLGLARKLLEALGDVVVVPESQQDAVTALSGSGPAYLFMYIEAMIDIGVELGLTQDLAAHLVSKTILGSTQLLIESGFDTLSLRRSVSSPGGTTIAATNALEALSFRRAIASAVRVAYERALAMHR